MNLLKIAFRNCWRNKRRCLITAGSIFIALFCALLLRSLQLGTYQKMIEESVGKMSGYLQVENPEYFYNNSLDNAMKNTPDLMQNLLKIDGVKEVVPRIQTSALISTGKKSKPAFIYAIDVKNEAFMSNPQHLLIHYEISSKAIERIKRKAELRVPLSKKLEQYKHTTYHDFNLLLRDLQIKEKKQLPLQELLKKECKVTGSYLSPNNKGVLLTNNLANNLHVEVGDTIILMGQGYHGATAAGLFPIRGLIHSQNAGLNNKLLYMTIPTAQGWLDMGNKINYLALNIKDKDHLLAVISQLKKELPKNLTVRNWLEYNPNLHEAIKGDNQGGLAMIYILYIVVIFGIYGTVLMMVNERKKEFHVLNAIGMKKRQLKLTLLFEMLLIGMIGIIAALITAIPIIEYYYFNPIELTGSYAQLYQEFGLEPYLYSAGLGSYIPRQILTILILVAMACYFPLRKINNVNKTSKK